MMRRTSLLLLASAIAAASALGCGVAPLPGAKARPVAPRAAQAAKKPPRAWPPASMAARVQTISGGMSPDDKGHATDVPAAQARYFLPNGLAWADGRLYVSHARNYVVTALHDRGGVLWSSPVAGAAGDSGARDGVGAAARFVDPQDMAVGPDGTIFVADFHGDTIRTLRPGPAGGAVGTLIPPDPEPVMGGPYAIAAGNAGALYVADLAGRQVVKVTRRPGGVEQKVLYQAPTEDDPIPYCVAVDDRETVYVGCYKTLYAMNPDGSNMRVVVERLPELAWDMEWADGHLVIAACRKVLDVEVATGAVRVLAGGAEVGAVDGVGTAARFTNAASLCFGEPGALYVADSANHRVCRLTFDAARPALRTP